MFLVACRLFHMCPIKLVVSGVPQITSGANSQAPAALRQVPMAHSTLREVLQCTLRQRLAMARLLHQHLMEALVRKLRRRTVDMYLNHMLVTRAHLSNLQPCQVSR